MSGFEVFDLFMAPAMGMFLGVVVASYGRLYAADGVVKGIGKFGIHRDP